MKTNRKRKNYYLDEKKLRRVRTILHAKTETKAIDAALNALVFRKGILKALGKAAGKGDVKKFFSGQASNRHRPVYRSCPKRIKLSLIAKSTITKLRPFISAPS
jgi:hypothetical protein